MRIEQDVKLDFKDVLFRPKRSTLSSRKEVQLERKYTFKHSGKTYSGIPIMAANMDGVGTFAMAEALSKQKLFTCLVKSYDKDDFQGNVHRINVGNFAVSTGTGERDLERLTAILEYYPFPMIQYILSLIHI